MLEIPAFQNPSRSFAHSWLKPHHIAVIVKAAKDLGLHTSEIKLTLTKEVLFSSTELDLPKPSANFLSEMKRGYVISLDTPKGSSVYHTLQDGSVVKKARHMQSLTLDPDAQTQATIPTTVEQGTDHKIERAVAELAPLILANIAWTIESKDRPGVPRFGPTVVPLADLDPGATPRVSLLRRVWNSIRKRDLVKLPKATQFRVYTDANSKTSHLGDAFLRKLLHNPSDPEALAFSQRLRTEVQSLLDEQGMQIVGWKPRSYHRDIYFGRTSPTNEIVAVLVPS